MSRDGLQRPSQITKIARTVFWKPRFPREPQESQNGSREPPKVSQEQEQCSDRIFNRNGPRNSLKSGQAILKKLDQTKSINRDKKMISFDPEMDPKMVQMAVNQAQSQEAAVF